MIRYILYVSLSLLCFFFLCLMLISRIMPKVVDLRNKIDIRSINLIYRQFFTEIMLLLFINYYYLFAVTLYKLVCYYFIVFIISLYFSDSHLFYRNDNFNLIPLNSC